MRESVILQSPCIGNRSLRVIFDWRGDRYGHCVQLVDGGQFCALLTSREGVHENHWPASPPLQQLHLEERAAGERVALLVGMSGRDHWSASVEMDTEHGALTFDLACRVSTPGLTLRSTYELNHDAHSRWELTPLECDHALAEVIRDHRTISILPAPTASRTVRWKYRIWSAAM